MKTRRPIRSISDKQAAKRPELVRAGRTVAASSIPEKKKTRRKRKSWIKNHNRRIARKPRKPSEFARIYGSRERVRWVKAQPSVASGKRPCVNAHTVTGGTQYKAGFETIVPLTHYEHTAELHQWGKERFEKHYGIDLDAAAVETARRYAESLAHHGWSA